MKTELVRGMSGDSNYLMQLSAWDDFIELCCHDSFKTIFIL